MSFVQLREKVFGSREDLVPVEMTRNPTLAESQRQISTASRRCFQKSQRNLKNDEDIQIIILLDSIGTKIRIKVTQMHRSDRTISERLSLGRGLPLFGKLESRTVSFEERRVSEVSLRRDDYLLVVEETSYVSCDRMYVNSV